VRRGRNGDREIIIIEEDSPSSLKWLMVGAALGAGLALLLAPESGEDTRRRIAKQAGRLRRAAEDTIDDLQQRLGDAFSAGDDTVDDEDEGEEGEGEEEEEEEEEEEDEDAGPGAELPGPRRSRNKGSLTAAREELEHRLAAARARRGAPAAEEEEPVA